MHPILFSFGKFQIFTYGFFIAVGFMSAIFLGKSLAKKDGIDPEKLMDLGFYLLLAAIAGSRLLYVFTVPAYFMKNPLEIFMIWKGGLVFYGGFALAFPTAIIYLKKHKMDMWKTLDIIAPALALGHFCGRIGCFFAGCCYGAEYSGACAVVFTNADSLAPLHTSLHPTQLYSAASNLTIFAILMLLRKFKTFDGQVVWTYIAIYASARSILEEFRGDFRGGEFLRVLSLSQTIAICAATVALVMLVILKRRHNQRNT